MGWTEQNLRDYTQRRLRDEQRTRTKLYKDYLQPETNEGPMDREFAKETKIMGDGLKRAFAATKGYSIPVVTAFFREHGIPEPQYEHQFCLRKWRWDLCWIMPGYHKVAIEVQGGLFAKIPGGHNRGAQILKEHEKYNEAACLGWRVLFCTPQNLCTSEVANLVKRCLNL